MIQITDVVKKLLILNVAIFILTHHVFKQYGGYFAFYSPTSDAFMPVQIVTHMFMHGDMRHLIFNMITLFFFGPRVENVWGAKKFIVFYFMCGLGSLLMFTIFQELVIDQSSYRLVGASGAIYGVLMAFALLYPNEKISLIFPPISGKAIYFILGLLAIDLFAGISGAQPGIANFAHLGGALIGSVFVFYWKSKKQLFDKW